MNSAGILVAAAALLVTTGCSEPDVRASPPAATPTPTASVATPSGPTPEEIVRDPRSQLLDAVAAPDGRRFEVAAWWGCTKQQCEGRRAIATSNDGFATSTYEKWSLRRWQGYSPLPARGAVRAFEGLAQETVQSLEGGAEEVQVVIAGGDGATLKPFQKVGRSTDDGESWELFDVVPIDGELALWTAAVGLSDGRLLVLLDHFSDDAFNDPADRSHGLWVSAGSDWTAYSPHRPTFSPPLTRNPAGWSDLLDLGEADGVVSVRTWNSKLYVSTDGAATFREIPAR